MQRRGVVATSGVLACLVAVAGLSYLSSPDVPPPSAEVPPGAAAAPIVDVRAEAAVPEPEPASDPEAEPTSDPEADRDDIDPRRAAFEARFPAQAAAVAGPGHGGDAWAVLIGINEHLGAVADNYVSREDAERMRVLLLRSGWADERIVLLTDTDATGAMMREALAWLARKTGDNSRVVFHYSGHSKKWYGEGGAIADQGLWPTDDDFIPRDELAAALAEVRHDAFWGNMATCEAAGFHVDGAAGADRVWTYSSRADEKSYEDPDAGHSVWGAFLLDHGLWRAEDRVTSVQDTFADAAPLATHYTSLQVPHGPQTPVLADDLGRPFELGTLVAAFN